MNNHKSGFTLIEVLLVIILLALLGSVTLQGTSHIFGISVKSSVRRFAALVKHAYDQATLTGRVHRIVLDLDKQTWALEAAPAGALPQDPSKKSQLEDDLRNSEKAQKEPEFAVAGKNLVEDMPKSVHIREVSGWRLGQNKAKTEGVFSIYAYPNGMIDEAVITLEESGKEDSQKFILTTQPLTGRVKVKVENPRR